MFFARHKIYTAEVQEGFNKINKVKDTGEREIVTSASAAFTAKSRYPLPKVLPLDFKVFLDHYRDFIKSLDARE